MNTVDRLKESRDLQRAKEILESNGYSVREAELGKGNPELADKLSVKLPKFSKIRPFEKEDYYGFAGAEDLPSGNPPYIYCTKGDYYEDTIVVSSDYDKVICQLYPDPDGYENIYFSIRGEESDMLSLADDIAKQLDAGMDIRKVAKSHGLDLLAY